MRNKQLANGVLYGFLGISVLNLAAQPTHNFWLEVITKPLLMLMLLAYWWLTVGFSGKTSYFLAGGLIFSWLGDVLLMLQPQYESMFIWGLAAFLLAHICYIITYRLARFDAETSNSGYRMSRVVMLLFAGGALLYLLWPVLGELKIPVAAYTSVIITMAMMALLRRGHTTEKSFVMVYSGALLFVMSDAMLAINKFLEPIYLADVWVMATYIAAQFLIVKGLIFHEIDADSATAEK